MITSSHDHGIVPTPAVPYLCRAPKNQISPLFLSPHPCYFNIKVAAPAALSQRGKTAVSHALRKWKKYFPGLPGSKTIHQNFSNMKTHSFTHSNFSMFLCLLSGCLFFLSSGRLLAQCPPAGITLTNQAAVNTFAVDYPTCTTINGSLQIGIEGVPSDITDLTPLSNLTTIMEDLRIFDNDLLTSLNGLQNLTQTGTLHLKNNDALASIAALSGLTEAPFSFPAILIDNNDALTTLNGLQGRTNTVRLYVWGNAVLGSLTGLENLTQAYQVTINFNAALTSLSALQNCAVTELLAVVGNTSLTSLNGLNSVTTLNGPFPVGDALLINQNPALTSLNGLNNLTQARGVQIQDNAALTSLTGLDNLTQIFGLINGNLTIRFNNALTSLDGLGSLNSIEKELIIEENPALTNIMGLSALTNVNSIYLFNNDALTSLAGLNGLTTIPAGIRLITNDGLTSLSGLNNLNFAATFESFGSTALNNLSALANLTRVNNMTFEFNDVLTSFAGLSNLDSVGQLRIANNPALTSLNGLGGLSVCTNLLVLNNATLPSLSGFVAPPTMIQLSITDNPLLANLTGLGSLQTVSNTFDIGSNPSLNSLSALSGLTSVGNFFNIYNNGALTSLAGLSSLTNATNQLYIFGNAALTSLNGLSALTSTKTLEINSNGALTSIAALTALTTCENLYLNNNDALTSLAGPSALTTLKQLRVEQNALLPNLNGLNLNAIQTSIYIGFNAALNNISALNSVTSFTGNSMTIRNNPLLSVCSIPFICGYVNGGGVPLITSNAFGCNTLAQILASCAVPPGCTALLLPANGATAVCLDAPLSWSPVANATGYRLRAGTTSGATNLVNNLDLGNVTTYQHPSNWPSAATIFVTITPYNTFGDAAGCSEESFQTTTGGTQTFYADTDGDGFGDLNSTVEACSAPSGYVADNTDCDDGNMNVNPGATEVCNGIDDDCDTQTDEGVTNTYYADTDGDGFGDPAVTTQACSPPMGYVANNTDCDDEDAEVNPGATEVCNGIDDDCDTQTDEGVTNTYYADTDGDGFGDPAVTTQACSLPMGYVTDNTDCDDGNMNVNPGATEVCNGVDDDCDTQTDEGVTNTYYADADGDGFGDPAVTIQACSLPMGYVTDNTDCDDGNMNVNPGATEVCNGVDDDCDTQTDEGVTNTYYADADGDGFGDPAVTTQACTPPMGYVANNTDCDDTNDEVYPGAAEICDGIDNDCDTQIDEDGLSTWYRDMDSDGFGDPMTTQLACSQPNGYVSNNTDCNDNSAIEKPGQVWYKDTDDDNYAQTGAATLTQCLRPSGYKAASELTSTTGDCNDNAAAINPAATEICDGVDNDCDSQTDEGVQTTYYRDMDMDGFGNPSVTQMACSQPSGYVTNNTDCNDNSALEKPGQIWYADLDNDGYSNGNTLIQCLRPNGHKAASELIATTGDCNDAAVGINPAATEICDGVDNDCDTQTDEGVQSTWYRDMDGDGFGDPAVTTQACTPPMGYVANNTDCDDTDDEVYPGAAEICDGIDNDCDTQIDEDGLSTWYRDMDSDGFGDPMTTQLACSQPNGYVSNNTDCNDNSAIEKPGQVWYKDTDDDNYAQTGAATLTQCLRPSGYKAASELTSTTGDCNDNAAAINPAATEICDGVDNDCDSQTDEGVQTTYYRDMDMDGFGNPSVTQMACSQPSGYVTNNTDCNDNSALEKPGQIWYADLDNDGYSNGNTLIQCLRPNGHKAASELIATTGDCNDAAVGINPAATEICDGVDNDCDTQTDEGVQSTWYRDMDGDGFGNPANSIMACALPMGYVPNNSDCNDNNALEKPGQVWYKDSDNDGYAENGAMPLTQCLRPTGYKIAGELTSTTGDCNDGAAAINPAASEVCDGVDNNCNGSTDDGVLITFYRDMDGDGFGNPAMTQIACSAPMGYVANNTDCNDNNGLEKPGQVWYKDIDNDGYAQTGAASLIQCLRPVGYKVASELTSTTGDCNDNDAGVNPASQEVCEGIDNNCDGEIDEGVKTEYFADTDGDGFGDPSQMVTECSQPQGYVLNSEDCDDTNGLINPAAEEVCDNIDNDCNGIVDDQGGVSGSNWSSGDVGTANGNAVYPPCNAQAQDVFTLEATGFSTSSSDKLHAVYQTLCGNGEITARVLNVSGGGWAGIMLRETLDPGSKKVALKTQLNNSIRREIRTMTNGAASNLNFIRPQHIWLRLARNGSNFVGYTSPDGVNWTFAFTATISMNGCIYAGLFAESINNAVTTTATFDQVSITGATQNAGNGNLPPLVAGLDGQTLELYPNPSTGYLNVDLGKAPEEAVSIQVISAAGTNSTMIRRWSSTDQTILMDLSELPDGVYFVRIAVPGYPHQVRRIVLAKLDGLRK